MDACFKDDYRQKEDALKQRSGELTERLKKRLEERRLAMDAFLVMKKKEETRIQTELPNQRKRERAELSTRLETLLQRAGAGAAG